MTKSQNPQSEQLTKQLATESLPEYTEFYVRKKDGSTDTQTWLNRRHSSAVEWWNTFNITEVLAPVPSYDELQNMNKAVNECMAANIKLVEENKNISQTLKASEYLYAKSQKEILDLKELLKECKTPLEVYNEMFGNKEELLTKIDEVLK